MGNGLRDDWFIEHTGESRILDQNKVAAEIERLRAALEKVAQGDDGMDSHTALGMQYIARVALGHQQSVEDSK